jgi:thiosulfate/3-mercaptopyruvate sulfurtransferase
MAHTTLIDVAALAGQLRDPDWILFDCRHDLAEVAAGRRAYAAGHVPGARHAHLDEHLSGPRTGTNGRHPLPDPEEIARWLGTQGVHAGSQVVAYDASGGCYAARLWWLLRWLGHDAVAVLDGGWPAWQRAGLPESTVVPKPQPATFPVRLRDAQRVDARTILLHLGTPELLVLDARSPERYAGRSETLDPVAGHIPGALNRPFQLNLSNAGTFLAPAELRQAFRELLMTTPPERVVHQCGSGVTACHNLLAMEVAGLRGSRLYPGSWSEWCADPSRPIEPRRAAP